MQKKDYNPELKNKAYSKAGCRGVVVIALLYFAWKILEGTLKNESTMQPVVAVLFTVFFAACAAGFAVYAIKGLLKDMKDAEVVEGNSEESSDESVKDDSADDERDDFSDNISDTENDNEEEN